MVEYEQLGKPNKISDDSSRAYFKKRRLFADEFFASIMNLYPVKCEIVYK